MENKTPALLSLLEAVDRLAPEINDGYLPRDASKKFSEADWNALGDRGFHGAFLPAEQGGKNASNADFADLLTHAGYRIQDNGLLFSVMAHALACLWPMWLHGKSVEVQKLLQGFAEGKLIGCNAMTEEQGGSDAFQMKTTAVRTNEGYRLSGEKSFCANGPVATHALVYALTNPDKGSMGGVSAFLVPLDTEGIERSEPFDKMGLRTCPSCKIRFKEVFVPAAYRLGQEGSGTVIFQESMVLEKIFMAASHTGTLTRWLEHMTTFASERQAGNVPLIRNQIVAHSLAEVKIQLEASKALVKEAVRLMETEKLTQLVSYASIVKYHTSQAMVESAQKYLNLFGGKGYLQGTGVEVQVRDFMASTIYSGTNEIQKNIISSSLLQYKENFYQ